MISISEDQGAWEHRRLALKLAVEVNPHIEVSIYRIVDKLLTQGFIRLNEEDLEDLVTYP